MKGLLYLLSLRYLMHNCEILKINTIDIIERMNPTSMFPVIKMNSKKSVGFTP
jgi:hypothetical protein